MKRMNFIDQLSATTHKRASRWFTHSAILLSVTLASISIMQGLEFYDYLITSKDMAALQANFDALQINAQEKQTLESKKNTLAQLRTHIQSCTLSPCSPHDTLCMLTTLSAMPIKIQSLQLNPEGLDLTAHAGSARHAPDMIACLKEGKSFANLELVSIQPHQQGVMMRIRGKN